MILQDMMQYDTTQYSTMNLEIVLNWKEHKTNRMYLPVEFTLYPINPFEVASPTLARAPI